MATKYTWAHINDVSAEQVKQYLPHREIVVDGDCGSVWGEHHPEDSPCPFPHVLVKAPTRRDLDVLMEAGIGYVADLDEAWGERVVVSDWREDDACFQRRSLTGDDLRTLYLPGGEQSS